jgi:radical SAM superfamily enzyme YgiQ (UPF0313 family)
MKERDLTRRFAVQASLNIADDAELLHRLHHAGCFAIMTGLESVSEASLRTMRKGINLGIGVDGYRDKIDRIHAQGMMVAGTFVLGGDGDGPDIFERTVRFVMDAGVDLAHFGILIPDPGTDLYERLAREGRLLHTSYPADYARHHLAQALFVPKAMTPAALEAGYRWAIDQVSGWRAVGPRAWRTWRATGNLFAAFASLAWTRTGLRGRTQSGTAGAAQT